MRINSEKGASLISMMIGMLVSMMSILAVMSMHKTLIHVSVESKSDAVHDGLISSAMVQLQLALHNAGYGMETSTAADVIATTVNSAPALLWRSYDGAAYICEGVTEVSYTDGDSNTTGRHLVSMRINDASCTETANLQSLAWNSASRDTLAQFRNQSTPIFDFDVVQDDCAPYGFGEHQLHLSVAVHAKTSAEVNDAASAGADISPITFNYCLANTHL